MEESGAHQTTTHSGDQERGDSAPLRGIRQCLETFWFSQQGVLRVSSVFRPGLLLNIPQGTQQPPTPKNYLTQNVSSTRRRNVKAQRWQVLTKDTQAQESPARDRTQPERPGKKHCSQDLKEEKGGENKLVWKSSGALQKATATETPSGLIPTALKTELPFFLILESDG